MSFRDYKKEIERKKEENRTLEMLEQTVSTFSKRKEEYIASAKDALRRGDHSAYESASVLLKNIMFQIAQTQDMITDFKTARDMRELNALSSQFTRSMDKIMLSLNQSRKQINFKKTKNGVQKALYNQSETAQELRDLLSSNGIAFAQTVRTVSDVKDEQIYKALQSGIEAEDRDAEGLLDELESLYGSKQESQKEFKKESVSETPQIEHKAEQVALGGKPASEEKTEKQAPVSVKKNREDNSSCEKKACKKPSEKPSEQKPEDVVLSSPAANGEFTFDWDQLPDVTFDDVAGLEDVKDTVYKKVLLPLKNPEAFEGYARKNGGGLLLYGPPGTGKTMIAAAIANEIGAKFCSVQPSDLLHQGVGQSEKAVKALFNEAKQFPCAVIYFDEMDSITPKSTKSQYSKHLRSELLAQMQGMDSYRKDSDRILFLIAATNKPWDIDSAFVRPGRLGARVYVGLPDEDSRRYMLEKRLLKLKNMGVVEVSDDIDLETIVQRTAGFNGSDIDNLFNAIEEVSAVRGVEVGKKYINMADFDDVFEKVKSSVQRDDIEKLMGWKAENG